MQRRIIPNSRHPPPHRCTASSNCKSQRPEASTAAPCSACMASLAECASTPPESSRPHPNAPKRRASTPSRRRQWDLGRAALVGASLSSAVWQAAPRARPRSDPSRAVQAAVPSHGLAARGGTSPCPPRAGAAPHLVPVPPTRRAMHSAMAGAARGHRRAGNAGRPDAGTAWRTDARGQCPCRSTRRRPPASPPARPTARPLAVAATRRPLPPPRQRGPISPSRRGGARPAVGAAAPSIPGA